MFPKSGKRVCKRTCGELSISCNDEEVEQSKTCGADMIESVRFFGYKFQVVKLSKVIFRQIRTGHL